MIQIVTKDGISLDLAPDAEFVIEYNNPMMEDDRIPVPFSTSIALLPSATNCKVFQYLPALKLEPAVKKAAVSLVLNGIPFLSGTLSYDGIEDGALNYTFAGKDLENDWGMKIYESEVHSYAPTTKNINAILDGSVDGVSCPLMVNKDQTGYFSDTDLIAASKDARDAISPYVYRSVKYHNSIRSVDPRSGASRFRFTPAVLFSKIVGGRISSYSPDIARFLPHLAAVAQYRLSDRGTTDEIASHLPDMSMSDFVLNMNRMFCAAIFEDGGKLVMQSFASIMSRGASEDWSDKVADEFSSDTESAGGYSFGYANSDEEAVNDGEDWATVESAATVLYVGLGALFSIPIMTFLPVTDKATGKRYSNKSGFVYCHTTEDTDKWMLVATTDVIFANNMKQSTTSADGDTVENIVDFNLVRCVPTVMNRWIGYSTSHGSGSSSSPSPDPAAGTGYDMVDAGTPKFYMAPIIEPAASDAENGSTLYVGLMNRGQLTDDGLAMPDTVPELQVSDGKVTVDGSLEDIPLTADDGERLSLAPGWLFEHYHKPYAQWLARDRQLLTCDVNLSEFDLLNFRMYRKIRIHGRDFLVKKLSVTLRADSDAAECSADFIGA